MRVPRILVAGLGGGDGKTLVSVGVTAALTRRWRVVAPFKKGPDYIDAAWLSVAAGRPCRNLDMFLMRPHMVLRSFAIGTEGADLAIVEGNRGIFDGSDARGTFSSAELAKALVAPVLLVVDATKRTRTAAAMVLGCQHLDPDVSIAGVVLNRTAGSRHESVLRRSIERTCGVPVVGAVPRMAEGPFPERHLGLVPPDEHGDVPDAVGEAARIATDFIDLDAVVDLATASGEKVEASTSAAPATTKTATAPTGLRAPSALGSAKKVRIGVFRDAAFQFYYPENLEALEHLGATLQRVSPLADSELAEVDALYIGGGFPETLAERLADNVAFRRSVREAVEAGLPVYAECGGAVYLGEQLIMQGRHLPMAAAVPAVFEFGERPAGHGYAVVEAVKPNPFYPVGTRLLGHEFHYTFPKAIIAENVAFAFRVLRGHCFGSERDGLLYHNVLALYTHVHALGTEGWAPALVRAAAAHAAGDSVPVAAAESATEAAAEVASP